QSSGPTLEKYCFDNIGGNCQAAGGFYQWDEAMQYSTSEGAQGICPSGWHVPSDAELNTLDQYLTDTSCDANRYNDFGCANAGNKLKVSGGSGFDAILGGVCYQGGPFYGPGIWASFWSSSMNGSNSWIRHLNASYASIYRGVDVRSNGFSIRCVQN
ncbi:MAG TPA: fibrobacter succinogenes major paralogous domain-containing protein, partial [bacterium]|nr:fibrobacter succinogenes major paralogous domain-containing protein [bacterium]